MGGIGEDPPKRGTNISRVRASFFSTLGARTKIGGTGLVGLDKVLMFVRSIDRKERMTIGIKLEDNDSANGFTEDWAEVERVCRGHDKKRTRTLSTIT